jgi:hypothetical protein
METRSTILSLVSLLAMLFSMPAQVLGQAASQDQRHDQYHPEATTEPAAPAGDSQANMMGMMAKMKAPSSRLDALVKKMNSATGAAKTEAIAELLTALVEERATCATMMANMASMKGAMGDRGNGKGTPTTSPK